MLPAIQRALQSAGIGNACFLVIGHGDEEAGLRAALSQAYFMGVQRGETLAQSCAEHGSVYLPIGDGHLWQRGA